ncbi:MAG TPA: acyltransferase [Anaeromyxobacter sp.]
MIYPRTLVERLLFVFISRWILRLRLKSFGKNSFVSPFVEILGPNHVSIGSRVNIRHDTCLLAIERYAGVAHAPSISVGDGTYIGQYCTVSCINHVHIGADVTFGDNVYVADSAHGFSPPDRHVMDQPLVKGSITIGDRAWLGKNTVVTHNVTIGEGAVVGANSFVNRDVPPYTIVAGNPAVPVKRYDFEKAQWVKV